MKKAYRKNVPLRIGLCTIIAAALPLSVHADGGKEFVAAHPMPLYQNSVPVSDSDRSHRLSKDSLEKVRGFFKAHMRPGDKMEQFNRDNETGFCITRAEQDGSGGRELTAREVCASKKTVSAQQSQAVDQLVADSGVALCKVDHEAFGAMSALVAKGRHSADELRAAEKEYGAVATSYYRMVDDPKKGSMDEGKLILQRAQEEERISSPQNPYANLSTEDKAGRKAAAEDMKRRMQELKARGDMAGMAQLAMGQRNTPGASQGERLAKEELNRDTWAIWLRCLKDSKAVAYATKIEYGPGVLAE